MPISRVQPMLLIEGSSFETREVSMNAHLKIAIFAGCALTLAACDVPLDLTTVSAPDINCVFDNDCTITVEDTSDHFTVGPTTGDAFLQSRTFPPGEPGTPAAGLHAYLYRIDLRQLAAITAMPCITEMAIDFGPVVKLDYDGNGATEHVFIVTGGALGNVAPSSATKNGRIITFAFGSGVCAGSSPGTGDSSFFIGLTSATPPRFVTAELADSLGGTTVLDARAPQP
jgi:hypothetical protein